MNTSSTNRGGQSDAPLPRIPAFVLSFSLTHVYGGFMKLENLTLAVVYVIAAAVVLMDVFVWRATI
jgi:hypothetical protein